MFSLESVVRQMVNKLRATLDANQSVPSNSKKVSRKRNDDISVKSSSKQFDNFLRYLSRCPYLLEAKRLRNDIQTNLRRARLPDGGLLISCL